MSRILRLLSIVLCVFCVVTFAVAAMEYKTFKSFDGFRISYHYNPPKHTDKLLPNDNRVKVFVVLQGRASNIKSNTDLYNALSERGYHVYTMDWRAHGESERTIKGSQKCHINSFKTYMSDLNFFINNIVLKKSQDLVKDSVNPKDKTKIDYYLLAVSMGGQISTRYLQKYHDSHPFKAAFLLSPMYGMNTEPFPIWFAKVVSRLTKFLGMDNFYAIGYGDYNPKRAKFEKSRNTSSRENFEKSRRILLENPNIITGGPTWGWLYSAYKSINDMYKSKNIRKIKDFPVFVFIGEKERVVRNESIRGLLSNLRNAMLIQYSDCKHSILKERKEISDKFWSDFDNIMAQIV